MDQPDNPANKIVKTKHRKFFIIGGIVVFLFICGFLLLLNKPANSFEDDQLNVEEILHKKEKIFGEEQQIPAILRSKEFQTIKLMGNQALAPKAFSKVYFNKKENLAYIDIKGLPEPPENKVYQFWSLQMEPFVPTSIGVLDATNKVEENLYKFSDFSKSGVLCITLEPSKGSIAPTVQQIYVLEMVLNSQNP